MAKTELLAGIRAARTELRDVLGRSDERTLENARVPGTTWTAKDVLAHLIGYDLAILAVLAKIRAGQSWAWPWAYPDFDPWNESNVGPRRARPLAAVLVELDTSRALLLRELAGWPEGAGPFGANSWDEKKSEISWVGPHEREHAELIAKLGT